MKIQFPDNSFVEISWAEPGTLGTGDQIFSVKFSQLGVSASARPCFESSELLSFLDEIRCLLDGAQNALALKSDTGQVEINVDPLDSLGHYCLHLRLGSELSLRGKAFQTEASANFELNWQDLADLASACTAPEAVGG